MNIKRVVLLVLFFFSVCLLTPKTSKAVDLREVLTSENSIILKIQEGVEYFFAFKTEAKVQVLEKQAEKRLSLAQGYAKQGNKEKVQNALENYLQIKEKQNSLLGKTTAKDVLGAVEARTIEQQKTMEEIKTKIDGEGKQKVVDAQEKVVNQVAEKIVEVKGTEGQTEFFNKVEHVWAPGTGPGGGESGVVYEGGGKLIFAPGSSAGSGNAASDIKTVEIKTGGGDSGNNNSVESGNQNAAPAAPGTTSGGNNTIDPGGVDPGTSSDGENRIDP